MIFIKSLNAAEELDFIFYSSVAVANKDAFKQSNQPKNRKTIRQ